MTRVVDSSGYVSFAGTNYRVGNRWRGRSAQVCIVAGSVQLSCDGHIDPDPLTRRKRPWRGTTRPEQRC